MYRVNSGKLTFQKSVPVYLNSPKFSLIFVILSQKRQYYSDGIRWIVIPWYI